MSDPKKSKSSKKQSLYEKSFDTGSNALSDNESGVNQEAFGSPSGSDPESAQAENDPETGGGLTPKEVSPGGEEKPKAKKKKGEDFADLEMKMRWKSLQEGDQVSYLIRDMSGQISGDGKIEKIYREGRRQAVHLRVGEGVGELLVCMSPEEITAVQKKETEALPKESTGEPLEIQPILPGTIKLDDAIVEMTSRRGTWDEALGELEAYESLMDERRKSQRDLRSKVKECRKLYVAAKRTVRSLGGDAK